jgi:hypothetical protein
MATRPSGNNNAQSGVQLCEFCQTKPRYGNHKHCSKTCSNASKAAKAATVNNNLCKNCQQKPKFGSFDYCGKNCAAQAGGNSGASKGSNHNSTSKSSSKKKSSAPSQPAGNNSGSALAQSLANAFLPQVQAAAVAALSSNPSLKPIATALQTSGAATAALNVLQSHYPGLNLSNLTGTGAQAGTGQPQPPPRLTNPFITAPSTGPVPNCRIPKCGKLVFVDSEGVYSEYCSQLCREEAVDTDLVSPCIMCMCLPQGKGDHFCSRQCRDEALSKPLPRPNKN